MKITIEGAQGEGKTHAAKALIDYLIHEGFACDLFDEADLTESHHGPSVTHKRAAIYIRQKATR
jgi:thymidylate kinase